MSGYGSGPFGFGPFGVGPPTETTNRLYERLPEAYRREDQGEQFKRFIASFTDILGEVEMMIDRFDYLTPPDVVSGDTSDLVNPHTADEAWLPWLAQLVGVRRLSSTVSVLRDRIASPAKFQAGTKEAVREAAKEVLVGEQHVEVYSHTTNVSPLGGATQWDMLIVTRATETLSDPTLEVIRLGAKPAGVKLYHRTYTTTWDAIEAAFPTWAAMEGKTWDEIEEAGL